jgi:hypothetical protein
MAPHHEWWPCLNLRRRLPLIKFRQRRDLIVKKEREKHNAVSKFYLHVRVLTNLIKSLKCSRSNSSCRDIYPSNQLTPRELTNYQSSKCGYNFLDMT